MHNQQLNLHKQQQQQINNNDEINNILTKILNKNNSNDYNNILSKIFNKIIVINKKDNSTKTKELKKILNCINDNTK